MVNNEKERKQNQIRSLIKITRIAIRKNIWSICVEHCLNHAMATKQLHLAIIGPNSHNKFAKRETDKFGISLSIAQDHLASI